jgi:photosystem II stability/assembly factor-like uncharacterized protein
MKTRIQTSLILVLTHLLLAGAVYAQGWTKLTPATNNALNGVFSVSSTMTIAVGDDGSVIGTTDGGSTWSTGNASTTENLNKVFVYGLILPVIAAVGDNGIMRYSTDVGATWNVWNGGTTENLNDIFVHDPTVGSNLTVVGDNGVIRFSGNSGTSWIPRTSTTTKRLNGVFFRDLVSGIVVGNDGLILSTVDGGGTWTSVTNGATVDLKHVFFTDLNNGCIVGEGGLIMLTTDAGQTWTSVTSPTTRDLERVSFSDANNGWATGALGTIIHTTDGGSTWATQGSGVTSPIQSIFFVDAMNGMAVGSAGLVLKTTNGGLPVELISFSAIPQPSGELLLRWNTATETNNYGFEVQRKTNALWEIRSFVAGHGDSRMEHAYTFTDVDLPATGTVQYRLRQIDYDGRWEYSPVVESGSARPDTPMLNVFPNPASTSATISLQIREESHVRVRVLSTDGRHIATMQDAVLGAGVQSFVWNPSALPNGVYLLSLETAGVTEMRRIIVQH